MPTLAIYNRQRVRERARPRRNAPGNFVTIRIFNNVYSLTFRETPAHYIKFKPYEFPYTKAFGYVDNPPLDPPLVPVGTVVNPEKVDYVPAVTPAPPVLPEGVAPGTTPGAVIEIPPQAGAAGKIIPGILPKQIFNTARPIRSIRVKAADGNAANIWWGYDPSISIDNAVPIIPGSGDVIIVSDASALWFVAENATDKFYYAYEV